VCRVYKDVCLEDYIAVPDDSCSITASVDAAASVVPSTLGLRPKPFDEAGFDVTRSTCSTCPIRLGLTLGLGSALKLRLV